MLPYSKRQQRGGPDRAAALSAQGRARTQAGNAVEKGLKQSHLMYERQGYALIEHLEPKTMGITGTEFERRMISAAACDYMGFWRPYGKEANPWPVAFDAKSFTKATIGVPEVNYKLKPEVVKQAERHRKRFIRQCEFLIKFTQLGAPTALGFLLLYDRTLEMGWLLFPPALQRMLDGETLKLRDIERVTKTHRNVYNHFPHLPPRSVADMVTGKPLIDWRQTLLEHHPLLRHHGVLQSG